MDRSTVDRSAVDRFAVENLYDQRVATSQLVNTDSLGVQPEKLRVRRNPRKGIISVRAGFYASRDAEFCVPEITPDVLGTNRYFSTCHNDVPREARRNKVLAPSLFIGTHQIQSKLLYNARQKHDTCK